MYFKPQPFSAEGKFLFEFFDKTLADIAKRSNIIRKDTKINIHNVLLNVYVIR